MSICKNCKFRITQSGSLLNKHYRHAYKNKYGNWTFARTYNGCDKPEPLEIEVSK